ncbi:MAG: RNA polymerase sigma factor, partial [Bacteroidota bacterium]|nr:RNA polymerase sigma factor [Bacteroidota bacterium]
MNINSLSDAQLVSNYILGEEIALSVLINRHQARLYGFIFSKIQDRDATEDVFQDTFIKVIRTLKRGNYNEQGKFLPWVMRIAHNLVIDYFRKNNRMPKFKNKGDFDIFSVLSDESPNAENKIVENQIADHVRVLLEELPEDQKT